MLSFNINKTRDLLYSEDLLDFYEFWFYLNLAQDLEDMGIVTAETSYILSHFPKEKYDFRKLLVSLYDSELEAPFYGTNSMLHIILYEYKGLLYHSATTYVIVPDDLVAYLKDLEVYFRNATEAVEDYMEEPYYSNAKYTTNCFKLPLSDFKVMDQINKDKENFKEYFGGPEYLSTKETKFRGDEYKWCFLRIPTYEETQVKRHIPLSLFAPSYDPKNFTEGNLIHLMNQTKDLLYFPYK